MSKLFIILLVCLLTCLPSTRINNSLPFPSVHPTVLASKNSHINSDTLNKLSTIMICAKKYNVKNNGIITLIDYSLPADKKRLWVFDTNKNKILFNTYVSHGIKSGASESVYFSDRFNDKSSSIGVFTTKNIYNGRHGMSLKLQGLDKDFNSHAYQRAIVMHEAWYVDENFIKKYGRPGRSWGCPAIPINLLNPILQTIKSGSLLVSYYPNQNWFLKSKFLNCNITKPKSNIIYATNKANPAPMDIRRNVLFADLNRDNKREESEPILTVTADHYQKIFKEKIPLNRMLRRQIDNSEYVALSDTELKNFEGANHTENLNSIKFVIANVISHGRSSITRLKIINMGRLKEIKFQQLANAEGFQTATIYFDGRSPINLKSTNQFIRWLGL